jgi:ADP-heptose:LPS heptosyltransferase
MQVGTPPKGMALIDWTDELQDFADTAALVEALDLVITVDTSVAHLAGGLGKPVWLLNRYATCWRWGMKGESTPWYPTMRIFRQAKAGDWDSVIRRVTKELRQLVDR